MVDAFCAALDAEAVVHRGFCDALGTPRALGPLHDIAHAHPHGLGRLLVPGAERHELFTAFLDMIGSGTSVTVIEDAHGPSRPRWICCCSSGGGSPRSRRWSW